MELECCVQHYDWGKSGSNSIVAQLVKESEGKLVKETTHYAELWMGVHPSGPSNIKGKNEALRDHLKAHPEYLGESVLKKFGDTLPFLFKVLSVETALSIQAHPTKAHAEQLYELYPAIYKDDNHKPEIAIALTKFEALCGFRPRSEIIWALENIPILAELLGKDVIDDLVSGSKNIQPCFEVLMRSDGDIVKATIDDYLLNGQDSPEKDLAIRLNKQFPGDVGILCVFWLNFLTLNPGEAIFLAPNEPHAYIFGDCVECMANSDNVVRAGLTPKFRDVNTLCEMLTYKSYTVDELKLKPVQENKHTLLFNPPVPDFAVAQIRIPAGETVQLIPRDTGSIVLCISGNSTGQWKEGSVNVKAGVKLFIPAGDQLTLSVETDQTLYQAFCSEV